MKIYSARRGFTVVELLVAMGIMLIVIAILMPAVHRANETAKGLQCLSNLREMEQAAEVYVSENQGYYPSAYYYANEGSNFIQYCWDFTTITSASGVNTIVPGMLWHTGDPAPIQQCPSFDGPSDTTADPYTGYNYNTSYIGHGQYESIPTPAQAAQIPHSDQVAIFGDGQWIGGADKFMRAPYPNPGDVDFIGRYSGTQGYRHLGKTNVAYCDGHAEVQSDCNTANSDGAANVATGTGFLSIDNRAYGAP